MDIKDSVIVNDNLKVIKKHFKRGHVFSAKEIAEIGPKLGQALIDQGLVSVVKGPAPKAPAKPAAEKAV